MTTINDIVLIYFEDQPFSFARIEDIDADIKKDWYHVKLLLLKLPLETISWILKDAYINGDEFTMGGKKMRFEKIEAPAEDDFIEEENISKTKAPEKKDQKTKKETPPQKKDGSNVVSLADRTPKT